MKVHGIHLTLFLQIGLFFPNVADQFDSPTELKIVYDDTNIYILLKHLLRIIIL